MADNRKNGGPVQQVTRFNYLTGRDEVREEFVPRDRGEVRPGGYLGVKPKPAPSVELHVHIHVHGPQLDGEARSEIAVGIARAIQRARREAGA